jgi:hypothetical protein
MTSVIIAMIVLVLALIASLILNAACIWYIQKATRQVLFLEEEVEEITAAISNFTNHLKVVYEMEVFYGDETLRYLLDHAGDIIRAFGDEEVENSIKEMEDL